MTTPPTIWQPQYTITSTLARHLMDVEAARAIVAEPSRRKRAYSLSEIYRQYIGRLSAMGESVGV